MHARSNRTQVLHRQQTHISPDSVRSRDTHIDLVRGAIEPVVDASMEIDNDTGSRRNQSKRTPVMVMVDTGVGPDGVSSFSRFKLLPRARQQGDDATDGNKNSRTS